jgi:hypothetical protein
MIWLESALAGLLILLICTAAFAGEADVFFPPVEGKALTGKTFRMPGDLTGKHTVLLVAFEREQQESVDTWIPRLEKLEDADEHFSFYEFPVLPEMNSVMRWFIYQGMRSGITSERARARTVTFHLNKDMFKEHLGIETEEVIQIFLVDETGAVIWRESGNWSEEKQARLMEMAARRDKTETDS